jgi:hypothetical protein
MGIKEIVGISQFPHDHITVDFSEELFEGLDQPFIPAATLGLRVIPTNEARVSTNYLENQIAVYSEPPQMTNHPYILENNYGFGKSIFFAGNVCKFYETYALTEYRKMIHKAARKLSSTKIELDTKLEIESIHISLRKQEGRLILHLINYTGSMTRPIQNVIPLENVKISIHESSITQVKCLSNNQLLNFESKDGKTTFMLPQLSIYEVIALELDEESSG